MLHFWMRCFWVKLHTSPDWDLRPANSADPAPQERLERRKVHEQLQVLRGNIRVCCRVRPCFRWAGREVGSWGGRQTAIQQHSLCKASLQQSMCDAAIFCTA